MSDRPIATDALATLGTIIGESEKRDAIHIAVENVVAQEKLFPGQDVGAAGSTIDPVGIVDPFLKQPVFPGQRFWLLIYPRKINSLRHVWSHPAFPDEIAPTVEAAVPDPKLTSEVWLRQFCSTTDCPDYETVIKALTEGLSSDSSYYSTGFSHDGEYITFYGRDAHGEIPNEFWDHVEVVTGKTFERATSFNCSC